MGRVTNEALHLSKGAISIGKGAIDSTEHDVECPIEPTNFGVGCCPR